jgi:hypothetical protein
MFGSGQEKTREMVALLVDHLDKILEVGEMLADQSLTLHPITADMTAEEILAENARLRDFLEGIRAFEMVLAARVDKARTWAREIRNRDGNLKLMTSLFSTGTQALADAMQELGDPRHQDFNGGEQALWFMKVRRLVPEHQVTLAGLSEIRVRPDYAIVGRIELEPLMDLAATFIETLDVHYQVLGPEEVNSDEATTPVAARAH